ncbi:Beta-lactamase family protein [Candidatus Bealeia paramacronuclearis]|uniref:Beta-lactamase family protein n=1 Tax=Candidatus Bealeia paramacronuclearis TaxID=1921001 RepID=A0ABZ2C4X4_9PROT|nr:Beta-lactamase family protein [Candidatus Bealeia paramacronuclearis]
MNLKKNMAIAFTTLFVFPGMIFAHPTIPEAIEKTIQKLDENLGQSYGAAAAILYQGKVVYSKTFGVEYEGGPAITADTYFALGSSSKPIAALVVSDLVKKGNLSFEGSVERAIPQIAKGIQLQHILSHTTGYAYKGNSDIEKGMKRPEILTKLLKSEVKSSPGKTFLYSNAAYSLLENVVEKALGKPWPIAFHEGLSKRGLDHIAIVAPPQNAPMAHPHLFDKKTKSLSDLGRIPKNYPEAVSSSAGVYASLNDLIAFTKLQLLQEFDHLHEPRTLAPDVFSWGMKFPRPESQIKSSYALGWRVFELKNDKTHASRLVFHGGYINGVSAFIGLIKKHDLAIVVVTNDDQFIAQRMGQFLWSEVIDSTMK